jgi:hypothetical protein
METSENLILKLNELLDGERFFRKRFDKLLNDFKELKNPKIILVDFEYYSWDRLRFLYDKKMELISLQDFETAAGYRTLEKECQEYLDIKFKYGINKSMFFFEKEILFYFYFGTARNDKKARGYLKKFLQERLS